MTGATMAALALASVALVLAMFAAWAVCSVGDKVERAYGRASQADWSADRAHRDASRAMNRASDAEAIARRADVRLSDVAETLKGQR